MKMKTTVQLRMDPGGKDAMARTFLRLTDHRGEIAEYALAPAKGVTMFGPGRVDMTVRLAGHDDPVRILGGPVYTLTDQQYLKLVGAIDHSIRNPPWYRVWGPGFLERHSKNCVDWARDIWNQAGLNHEFGIYGHWNHDGRLVLQTDLVSAMASESARDAAVNSTTPGQFFFGTGKTDILRGDERNNVLAGGGGRDRLEGGDGDDVLIGGRGNDVLIGGRGSDTYVFRVGDGVDIVANDDLPGGGPDVIQFLDVGSAGLRSLRREDDHLLIDYGADDSIRINKFFRKAGDRPDLIRFSDDGEWRIAQLVEQYGLKPMQLGTGDDKLTLSSFPETVHAGDGNDALYGRGGDDVLFGEAGNDLLRGNKGADLLSGGAGNDVLFGDEGDDVLRGDSGNDRLEGGRGNDILVGGQGDDVLKGGDGDDAYLFSAGDGVDTVVNCDPARLRSDLIRFTDVRSDALRAVRREGRDILLDYGIDDCVRIQDQLSGGAYRIDGVVFSDGVRWHASRLSQMTEPGL